MKIIQLKDAIVNPNLEPIAILERVSLGLTSIITSMPMVLPYMSTNTLVTGKRIKTADNEMVLISGTEDLMAEGILIPTRVIVPGSSLDIRVPVINISDRQIRLEKGKHIAYAMSVKVPKQVSEPEPEPSEDEEDEEKDKKEKPTGK